MITTSDLLALGLPRDEILIPLAMKLINTAIYQGADPQDLREKIRIVTDTPETMFDDPLLGELAKEFAQRFPEGSGCILRKTPAPWLQWGDINLEKSAISQMEKACSLPVAVRGALMPDAHTGYGLPIGGVLAVKDAVIPYAVGVDIACRMRLSILDMPVSSLLSRRGELKTAIEKQTRFGVGAKFEGGERRKHAVMDEDWNVSHVTNQLKDKAWTQLGTSGGGNHFVEFGELHLEASTYINDVKVDKGVYLALLSHSGSRGTGENVATYYSQRARDIRPGLPDAIKHLAWLGLDSADGQEYWNAMELMGRYAAANHELIHSCILDCVGALCITHVENHHNFAWKEYYDGENVIIHRKGATPAGNGVLGVVPGSMGAPGFVVRGKGNIAALESCSHGAGRLMSRKAASKELDRNTVLAYLEERGVELISGGLDEAPMAYKDIHAVMAAQQDLVDIVARFEPRLVKMAPDGSGKPKWKKKIRTR